MPQWLTLRRYYAASGLFVLLLLKLIRHINN
jgi:hypothetical protein